MDAQAKAKLEQRAAVGLVVLFMFVLASTLRNLGVFGRRQAAGPPRPATVASNSAPPTLPSVVQEYRRQMDPQVELPAPVPTPGESQTAGYSAQELRDPLTPLLPRKPEPESNPAMSEAPQPSSEWVASAAPTQNLVVQGLWWGGSQPKAIINDEVYGVGDTVGGAVVTAIGRAGVTVEFSGRTIQLAPTQEPGNPSMSGGSPGSPWR